MGISNLPLGQLEKVTLETIWSDEAQDFTRHVIIKRIFGHRRQMIVAALRGMDNEFDKYIENIQDDVPWYYNERATLGFFVSGLVRYSVAIVLQEFSCCARHQLLIPKSERIG